MQPAPRPVPPTEPNLEEYALTRERVNEFERAEGRVETLGCMLSFLIVTAIGFIIIYLLVHVPGFATVIGAIVVGVLMITPWVLLLLTLIGHIMDKRSKLPQRIPPTSRTERHSAQAIWISRWARRQPDHTYYMSYKAKVSAYQEAIKEYKEKEAAWKKEEARREAERLRKQLSYWQSLDGKQFEKEVAKLLRGRGYQVQEVGKTGDEGVDLILSAEAGETIIQCKAHKSDIGVAVVREIFGVLVHRQSKEAWVVSVSRFTSGAREFADSKPCLKLIEISDLIQGRGP